MKHTVLVGTMLLLLILVASPATAGMIGGVVEGVEEAPVDEVAKEAPSEAVERPIAEEPIEQDPCGGKQCSLWCEWGSVPGSCGCKCSTMPSDSDGDGVADSVDNCPDVYNPPPYDFTDRSESVNKEESEFVRGDSFFDVFYELAVEEDFSAGSFFDVFCKLTINDASEFIRGDSFFDVFTELTIGEDVKVGDGEFVRGDSFFDVFNQLAAGEDFPADSFFDVFTELTVKEDHEFAAGDSFFDVFTELTVKYPGQADSDNDGVGDVCDACLEEDTGGRDINKDGCPDSIKTIETEIVSMDLKGGIEKSLLSTLDSAQKSVDNGKTDAAINQLEAFINKVEAQRGKNIAEKDADLLIAYATSEVAYLKLKDKPTSAEIGKSIDSFFDIWMGVDELFINSYCTRDGRRTHWFTMSAEMPEEGINAPLLAHEVAHVIQQRLAVWKKAIASQFTEYTPVEVQLKSADVPIKPSEVKASEPTGDFDAYIENKNTSGHSVSQTIGAKGGTLTNDATIRKKRGSVILIGDDGLTEVTSILVSTEPITINILDGGEELWDVKLELSHDEIQTEIVSLTLTSAQPITIKIPDSDEELWDVKLELKQGKRAVLEIVEPEETNSGGPTPPEDRNWMNKAQLIDSIAKEAKLTKTDTGSALDAFITSTTKSLELNGADSYGRKYASKVVRFKAGSDLSKSVKSAVYESGGWMKIMKKSRGVDTLEPETEVVEYQRQNGEDSEPRLSESESTDKPDLEQLQFRCREIAWEHKEQNTESEADWLDK